MGGEAAHKVKESCPVGVFDIEDMGGVDTLKVTNPRSCTMCRECSRHSHPVKLLRKRDHFIFSVESTGALPPAVLVEEAIKIFIAKCASTLTKLEETADASAP